MTSTSSDRGVNTLSGGLQKHGLRISGAVGANRWIEAFQCPTLTDAIPDSRQANQFVGSACSRPGRSMSTSFSRSHDSRSRCRALAGEVAGEGNSRRRTSNSFRKADIANVRLEFESGCVGELDGQPGFHGTRPQVRFFQPRQYISVDYSRQEVLVFSVGEPGEVSGRLR